MKTQIILTAIALSGVATLASAANWPPETGAKVPGNVLEYPTKLAPVNRSLQQMLNEGATLVSSGLGENGPVVTLHSGKSYVICVLKGAGTGSDQNAATSKCYAMN